MERLKQVQGIIFDLDGTLLDSMSMWDTIDTEFLKKRNLAISKNYLEAIKTMEFEEAAQYTIAYYHLSDLPASLMNEWNQMARDFYEHRVKLKPMVKEYIEYLVKQNIKLGIATSLDKDLCMLALKNNNVYDYFSTILTTIDVAKGKECADVYLKTASRLKVKPSKCAVFEDTLQGIQTAKQAGFITVGVYDQKWMHEQKKIKKEADIYIISFNEVLK